MSYKIGIVCSEFNRPLVEKLYQESTQTLSSFGLKPFVTEWVPGAGEIPLAIRWLVEKNKLDGVLALGVVIKGETDHYSFLKEFLEKSLASLQMTLPCLILSSVLFVETRKQAEQRVEGEKSKGQEVAQALKKMFDLKEKIFR